MCGRFSLSTTKAKIKEQFGIDTQEELQLSFNIAPTHRAYVIANNQPQELQRMYWGMVPYWSNDGKNTGKLINARGESISTKPSFRMSIRQRRCLVLADSFYEWKKEGQQKIPYRIKAKENQLLALAGIWDVWTNGEKSIQTFSIITTTANREVSQLHQRMPVIFDTPEAREKWLTAISLSQVLNMLQPLKDDQLEMYRISTKLNSPSYDKVDLHESIPEPPTLFN